MKKLLCFLLCLTLIFSSVSLCFAQDWSASDSQNLQNVAGRLYYMNQSAAYYLYNIANNTNNLYNKTVDIYNALFNDGHNITYWIRNISSWMSPIYNAVIQMPIDLEKIYLSLGYNTDVDGDGNLEYHSYLYDLFSLDSRTALEQYPNGITLAYATSDGQFHTFTWAPTLNWRNNFLDMIYNMNNSLLYQNTALQNYLTNGFNYTQTYTNWTTLQNASFTPGSSTNGIYSWLSYIQSPLARLSYVLASDERIEAQEAAAANEEAVVDNFIDSSGDGAASPSDFGSVSGLSSGYKQNFATDASPSGIFDIFNSDHATWFSQETKNQLDTTTPSRMTKSSVSETPLLDKQIEDIYDALGVKQP